ncbi:hypothetical protein [Fimbriiglobus ruber]|uniref:Uncharacterized protein n=1 Tax=Fimbriiglobus ruber TaxID=1908690 RepID=A0A225DYQ8_9BACT|nr:hypothetical protein [Fimbriiglobus ruber]OWK46660.1 hypothetical protein FRUB_00359 [Fimbriiglobus ruber]
MNAVATQNDDLDSVNNPRHPFGLPLGSVRGLMSLVICLFFWMVLLWPEADVKAPLAHFFLLSLVLMAFASSPSASIDGEQSSFTPWLLRVLFVGGSIAVVGFVAVQDPERLRNRLTPDQSEFAKWWGPFLASMASGFASGLFMRFILGRTTTVFQSLRAWFSVVGLLLLVLEIGMFVMLVTSRDKPGDFMQYWQAIELFVVAAYFGTRA